MGHLKSITLVSLIAVATIAISHFASAQSVDDWRKAKNADQPKFKLVQSYNGTTPGTGNTLPKAEELKSMEGSWITWPGFMMKTDGGSRIFLQTTDPLKFTKKISGKKIVITFKKTQIYLSNNKNPLVTKNFNTPLLRASLKKHRKHAQLILQLKQKTDINIMQVSIEDGYNYIFIDFPAGQYSTNFNTQNPSFSGGGQSNSNQNTSGQTQDNETPN